MLHSLDSRPDIIAITETRLNPNSISNVDCQIITFSILIHLLLQVVQLSLLARTLQLFSDQIRELTFH